MLTSGVNVVMTRRFTAFSVIVMRAARQLYRRRFSLIALRLSATGGDCSGRRVGGTRRRSAVTTRASRCV